MHFLREIWEGTLANMALGLVLRSESHLYWGSGHGTHWRGEGKERQKLGLGLMNDSPKNKMMNKLGY